MSTFLLNRPVVKSISNKLVPNVFVGEVSIFAYFNLYKMLISVAVQWGNSWGKIAIFKIVFISS